MKLWFLLLPMREKVPAVWRADEGSRRFERLVRPLIRHAFACNLPPQGGKESALQLPIDALCLTLGDAHGALGIFPACGNRCEHIQHHKDGQSGSRALTN